MLGLTYQVKFKVIASTFLSSLSLGGILVVELESVLDGFYSLLVPLVVHSEWSGLHSTYNKCAPGAFHGHQ